MENIFSELNKSLVDFKKNSGQFLLLFISLDLLNGVIIIPFFRFITNYLLEVLALPFDSWRNILVITIKHTGPLLFFLLAFLVLFFILYLELTFLLLSVKAIKERQYKFSQILQLTFSVLKQFRMSTFFLFLAYFLLVMPFIILVFRTPLLAAIKLPQFILDYLTRSFWLGTFLFLFYVYLIVFGLRWVYALPLIIFKKEKTKQAIKESWRATAHSKWHFLAKKIALITLAAVLFNLFFAGLIYLLQTGVDLFPGKYAYVLAILNLLLLQIVNEITLCWSVTANLNLLLKNFSLPLASKIIYLPKKKPGKFLLFLAIIYLFLAGLANYVYLFNTPKLPLAISHRGVDNHNSVQNTVASLRKIHQEKPDLVEIDVHETKDHHFVVMHDENLAALTGVNREPSELTLREMMHLKAKEDGHEAYLASLKQYLKAAQHLHQRILIEIKTTPHDTKDFLPKFNREFGPEIIRNKDQVQSLDYHAVAKLHTLNPKLDVFYLEPYNFADPRSQASGYAMEYSTINMAFVWQAHLHHHPVYVWTVNDGHLMKKMMYEHVDGIITDRLALLKKKIREFRHEGNYANRIRNYVFVLPMKYDITA